MKKGVIFSLAILSVFAVFAATASPANAEFLPPSGSPVYIGK